MPVGPQTERRGGTWNIQGFRYKYREVKNWMATERLDWAVITETWLFPQAPVIQKPLQSDDWLVSLVAQPRENNPGSRGAGGLALMVNPHTTYKTIEIAKSVDGRWAIWEINGDLVVHGQTIRDNKR